MQGRTGHEYIDVRDSLAVLWRRKWLLVTAVILSTGAAIAASLSQTPLYTTTARVLVEPIQVSPDVQPTLPNLETESQIVASHPVARLVAEETGTEGSPAQLIAPLRVSPIPDSEVLEISYTATTSERAAELANAFSAGYIAYKQGESIARLLAAQEAIQDRIQAVRNQLLALDREIREARGDEELTGTLQGERVSLLARLGVLEQQLEGAQPDRAGALGGGQIIRPAPIPESPSSPNHRNNAAFGLLVGLLAGVGAALLRERLDDRLRTRGEVERAAGAPVLAAIPRLRRLRRHPHRALTLITDPHGAASESYRSLRTNVEFILSQQDSNALLVTSARAAEGKTITAANLSIAFAQAGFNTVLISADLRRPTLESFFGIPPGAIGLSTWLKDPSMTQSVHQVLWGTSVDNLALVPSGPIRHDPAELLSSPRLIELLRVLEDEVDFVILDSAPILPVADSTVLASRISNTLLVVDHRRARGEITAHAIEELSRVGSSVIGVTMNGIRKPAADYYQYKSPGYGYQTRVRSLDEKSSETKSRTSFLARRKSGSE